MKIKLFGKSLFEFNKRDAIYLQGMSTAKESKFLMDFYTINGSPSFSNELSQMVIMESPTTPGGVVAVPIKTKKQSKQLTPKNVYEMKMLHDESFKLNVDSKYIDKQLEDFKDKLKLISSEEYDMRHGVNEIASIVTRLENRKQYVKNKEFFETFPYTTTSKVNEIIKKHNHLKLGQIAQFMADMPKEATDVMKKYNEVIDNVCGKQAVFYIIANKKDFQKTEGRRDPILLAQSPFGHIWQILGAWDEEMLLIEEL